MTYQIITKWGSKGTGDGEFSSPWSVDIDPAGDVYVIDDDRIQKFKNDGTFVETIRSPELFETSGIAIDSSGKIYVSTYGVRIVVLASG